MSTFEHIVVAGCNGEFGRVFARKLRLSAARLTGVDLAGAPAEPGLYEEYVQGSIEHAGTAVLERAAQADCIVLCMPEPAILAGLEALLGAARADACVADIASVKTRVAARVTEAGGQAGYLGLHPMFAPAEDFAGRNLVVVRIRENAATARLEALAATWQARLTQLTAEAHDRLTACVQVLPHAALLALGTALSASEPDAEAAEPVATPVHETLLSLLARMLRGRNETYWSIQTDNPYAAEARAGLIAALTELDSMASRGDDTAFARLTERICDHLGDALEPLAARSERIVDAACVPGDDEPAGSA